MLTRLKVTGFKNLVDSDVRFGPFTCVAGANGVGKSNLFDAIGFLRALADRPLIDAARSVRDETGRASDVRNLFHRVGDKYSPEMAVEAEMIIAQEGVDDLGQAARASITFLRYSLRLGYRTSDAGLSGALEVLHEQLVHINQRDAVEHLRFPHKLAWRRTAVRGRRTSPLISTEYDGANRIIKLHQEGRHGRPLSRSAPSLPRTVLSSTNAAESPTALLARNEMRSWRLLQLEPLSLRQSDDFTAPTKLGVDGSHLPATLYHLAQSHTPGGADKRDGGDTGEQVYSQVANRLADLIDDVREVGVERDEKRELLTLWVAGRDGTHHAARALSDGTLRFLALSVIEQESESSGLLCLEEPENGIHPGRIPAMLRLLQDIAVDANEEVGVGNPLRQVIVNTHSPAVVTQVPEDSLVVAELQEQLGSLGRYRSVSFHGLSGTWRPRATGDSGLSRGKLLAYLNPAGYQRGDGTGAPRGSASRRRVIDREDLQQLLFAAIDDA